MYGNAGRRIVFEKQLLAAFVPGIHESHGSNTASPLMASFFS